MTLWKVEQNLGNWTFKLRFKMAKYANRMNIKRNGIKEGICISFFEIVHSCMLSHVHPYVTPWTAFCQAPLSMEFSRQEYWNGLPRPTPGDFPDPQVGLTFFVSHALIHHH